MKDTLHLADPKPRMVAHRGTSGLELENTNSAFVAAGNRSYFGIETDVHRTADGHRGPWPAIVVTPGPFTLRTSTSLVITTRFNSV